MKTPSTTGLDESVLNELRQLEGEGGVTLLDELLTLFLEEAPKNFQKIREAVENQNGRQLAMEAHRLKSSCGNLGAKEMQAFCQTFEKLGTRGQMGEATRQWESFASAFAAALQAVRDYSGR